MRSTPPPSRASGSHHPLRYAAEDFSACPESSTHKMGGGVAKRRSGGSPQEGPREPFEGQRPGPPSAHPEAGFSLLEVIVALAVFALGALALLNVLGESNRSQAANHTRAIARIVAENQLVEVMALREAPIQGTTSGLTKQMDRTWQWERTIAPTEEPRILRISVTVREQGQPQTLAEFSSFRAAQ